MKRFIMTIIIVLLVAILFHIFSTYVHNKNKMIDKPAVVK